MHVSLCPPFSDLQPLCILSLTLHLRHIVTVLQQVTERVDVCVEDETVSYLNRKDVQAALHANLIGVTKWTVCSRYAETLS